MAQKPSYEQLECKIRELEEEAAKRERVMEAIKGKDKFLQEIFNGIQEGISVLDRDFTITRVNKWIEQTHQADMPVVGKKCYEVYQKRQTICPQCPSVRSLSTGEMHVEEVKVPVDDGTFLWIELSAYPLKDENGKITGVIEHIKEITDRKQAEAQLQDSEEKFRALTEQSPTMIFINKRGRVVYVNRECEEKTGYSKEEFYSPDFDFMNLVAPESKGLLGKNFQRHMAGEDIGPYEYAIISKDGKKIDVINSPKLIDYEGERAILGIVTDITKQKEMEKALQSSEAQFRTAIESLPFDFFLIDENGRYVLQNSICRDNWGNVVGKRPEDLYVDEKTSSLWESNNRRALAGEVVRGDVRLNVGGKEGFYHNIISPILDDGKVNGILGVNIDITDRKRMEESLRKSEIRYRQLFQHAPSGIYEIDFRNLRFISVNDVMIAYTGYSEDEFMHMNPLALFTERGIEVFQERQRLLRQGKPVPATQEYEIKRKDGSTFWALLNLNYEMENGEPIKARGVAHDISEREEMERALRESEEKYRELADLLPQVVFESDAKGNLSFANRNAFDLFGYSQEEFDKGLNAIEMLISEDHKRAQENMRRTLQGETAGGVEYTAQKKNGTTFPVVIYSTPIIRENKPVGLRGIIIDLTKSKQAEETLQSSETKFRSLFDFSPQAIALTEVETGRLVDVNDMFCALTGFTREEALGRAVTEGFYAQGDRNRFLKEIRSAGEVFGMEMDFVVKNGSTLNAQMFARTIDIAGEPHILTIFHDMTERKRLEAQLHQAQKMEAIGTLAGGVAHDFNNLLMGIQGHASLMSLDTNDDHPHSEHVNGIEEMVRRGADLTKQLLGFARRGKYAIKPTDLNDLIEKSSQWFGRTKKEITIQRKYQKNIWPVEVDPGQIEQVFLNLYVNAWQAMSEEGEIHLVTKNVTLDESFVKPFNVNRGNYVKITVTDTGAGMDEDTRKRIFDPFFTTKEVGKGTGLGLASAYGIIVNHDGIIDVHSKKGEGTTFDIYLPASEKEIISEKKVPDEILKGEETILLVDDEEMIINVGETILKTLGYTTLAAKNGKEAIDIYKNSTAEIDMVILDVIMPVMSGGETYDRLKELNPALKVLLSSGYSIDGQAKKILDRGCDGFIQKPFNMKGLSQKIREILDKT